MMFNPDGELRFQITKDRRQISQAVTQLKEVLWHALLNRLSLGQDPSVYVDRILDEDAMGSDSETALATQQSIKAYTDTKSASTHTHKFVAQVQLLPDDEALTVEDGVGSWRFIVPDEITGWNLTEVWSNVETASSSGLPSFAIYNVTQTADMLSTNSTIDANEKTSRTATTAAVIDTANDDVTTDDVLRVDCDVAGTGTAGLWITLVFEKP